MHMCILTRESFGTNWRRSPIRLQVCRVLMLSQQTTVIIKPLGDLLSLLWMSYEDIDVRDHGKSLPHTHMR